jgi:hypothetical protein
MGLFDTLFGGSDKPVDPREEQAIAHYRKTGKVPRTAKGWFIPYIPSSLHRVDQQRWMQQTDGALQLKRK